MKKSLILILLVIFVGLFFAACEMNRFYYCPYCSNSVIKKISTDDNGNETYKCQRSACGKTFIVYKF
jgi:transposase-like protein